MLIHNNGHVAAALHMLEIKLPEIFNVDGGLAEAHAAKVKIEHGFDDAASEFLGVIHAAKQAAIELAERAEAAVKSRAEQVKELAAVPLHGASDADSSDSEKE